jgi:hypothetical protein
MDIHLTLSDIIGLISLLISIGFNVYFIFDKFKVKTKEENSNQDLRILTEIINNITVSLQGTQRQEFSDINISEQLKNLYALAQGNLKKYKIQKDEPLYVFCDSIDEVNKVMIDTINNASKYILIIGGRTRVNEYVQALDSKINSGIKYIRLITGDHIRELLFEHINKWIGKDNIEIKYLGAEDKYGGLLVTNGKVFIALKTNDTHLGYGILINNQSISEEYRSYIEGLSTSAQEMTNNLSQNLFYKHIQNLKDEGDSIKHMELLNKYQNLDCISKP